MRRNDVATTITAHGKPLTIVASEVEALQFQGNVVPRVRLPDEEPKAREESNLSRSFDRDKHLLAVLQTPEGREWIAAYRSKSPDAQRLKHLFMQTPAYQQALAKGMVMLAERDLSHLLRLHEPD
jgi:hypothetical protein